MRQHTVYTEVVACVAQRAGVRGGVVTQECCKVAVAVPGLQAKEPLMPGQSAVLHGTPRDWVDMFMGVLGYQVLCPYLVRGQHSLSMPDDVPGGLFCLLGGGQRCTILGMLIRAFLMDVSSMTLDPFNRLVLAEEGFSGLEYPSGVPDQSPTASGGSDSSFAVDSQWGVRRREVGS